MNGGLKKIGAFCKKHEEFLLYMLFGCLTTAVNYAVYYPCYNWLGMSSAVSNIPTWVLSVLFAFLTNKPFVFKSHDWSPKVAFPELVKFVSCRFGSFLMETGLLYVTVDLLKWNGNVMKVAVSVLVIILNYLASKLLIFRKK